MAEKLSESNNSLIYPLTFLGKEDQIKVQEMVKNWQDKTEGYLDGNPDFKTTTLYAGENENRAPVAFVFKEREITKVIVVGKTPELAEKHLKTIKDILELERQ